MCIRSHRYFKINSILSSLLTSWPKALGLRIVMKKFKRQAAISTMCKM